MVGSGSLAVVVLTCTMSLWAEILVGVLAGTLTGAASAWITPGAQWRIDRQRQRVEVRRRLLADVRALVAERQADDRGKILTDPRYLAVHRHLQPAVANQLREQQLRLVSDVYGVVGHPYLSLLRDEADRLEREWDLP